LATTNKNFKVKNGLEVAGEIGVGSTPSYGTTGQILSSQGAGNAAAWIDVAPAASYTSVVKHDVRLGEAINKGQAVYVSSSNGTNMLVSKASNASEATSSKTLGLLESSGSTNNQRNVVTEGLLGGIDVGSAVAGDPVWLGTSGNLIYGLTNKPIAPAHLVFIGIVTRTGNNGEIFIRVQNGFELNELHTVLIGTDYSSVPADNNILAYDSASSLWKNQTAEQAGVANLAGATFTGNVAGTNANLSGNVNSTTVNTTTLLVGGDANVAGKLSVTAKSGDEGGEIFLSNAATNTVITNGVTIDVYQNKLRFFEQGGDARGFFINVAAGGAGAGTNLVGGGSGDGNTTYNISAVTTTGGSLLRLTSVDPSGTDDVKFAGSGATTVAFTDANTITISSTDTTYTNGTGLTLTGNSFSVTSNTYQPIDADLTAIAALANSAGYLYNNGTGTFSYSTPTDTNTTYTLGAAGTTSPTITLTPSSGSANTITLATSGTGISFGQSSGTITLTSNASDANGASTIVARNATGNFTANTITANLTGTASSATSAATATSATQVNTVANTTSATFYPTFVDANNGTTAVENVYTGAGLTFNPSTNTLTTTDISSSTLRLTSTGEATGNSTTHALQIGASNAANLRFDANEVQAASNNSISTLYLNPGGGNVNLGSGSNVYVASSVFYSLTGTVLSGPTKITGTEVQFPINSSSYYTLANNTYTLELGLGNYFSNITTQRLYNSSSGWTIVGTNTYSTNATGTSPLTYTLVSPGTTAEGDVAIVVVTTDSATNATPTVNLTASPGWTTNAAAATTYGSAVFYKTLTATPDTTIVLNYGATDIVAVASIVVRSSDILPVYVTAIATPTRANSTSGVPTPAATTTTIANTLVVTAGSLRNDIVDATASATGPVGYSNYKLATAGNVAGTAAASMLATKFVSAVGTETPTAFAPKFANTVAVSDYSAAWTFQVAAYLDPTITLTNTSLDATYPASTYVLHINNSPSTTTTWSGQTFRWQSNTAPTLSSAAGLSNNIVILETIDGSTFRGVVLDSYA